MILSCMVAWIPEFPTFNLFLISLWMQFGLLPSFPYISTLSYFQTIYDFVLYSGDETPYKVKPGKIKSDSSLFAYIMLPHQM
jgi:hypothetical protein